MKKRYRVSQIPENGCKGMRIRADDQDIDVVLVRQGSDLYCYRNNCPHTGVNLDWMPDEFLDISGKLLQCSTHGALFRPSDGYCLSGPCAGQSLQAVKLVFKDDIFEIELT